MRKITELGKEGEERVARYLEQEGFTILAMNYTQRTGEVDIIASKSDLIVFVEVKLRTKLYFDLSDVITPSKQKKIVSAAKVYLADPAFEEKTGRFDVALIDCTTGMLTYLANAFQDQ